MSQIATHTPTPYDTGERLQPMFWPAVADKPESYGRVDFEDDESATQVSAYVEREGDGYVVHLAQFADDLTVVLDGVRMVPANDSAPEPGAAPAAQ